ncbi:hypothetical protein V1517DRAFT_355033 [Lipomyces orientalis]|uniref:Uncharacterized protein n=1 Tax=Lipomyces orientalis TaxID=1233043 RepID=A0ACC3TET6_9ASCO
MPTKRNNARELQIFEDVGLKRWTPSSFRASTLASRTTMTVLSSARFDTASSTSLDRQTGKQQNHRKQVKIAHNRKEWSAEEISSLKVFERFVDGNAQQAGKNNDVQRRLAEVLFPGRPYAEILERLENCRVDFASQPACHDAKRRKFSSKLQELRDYELAFGPNDDDLGGHNDDQGNKKGWVEKKDKLDAILGLPGRALRRVAERDSNYQVEQAEDIEPNHGPGIEICGHFNDMTQDSGVDAAEYAKTLGSRGSIDHIDKVLGLGKFGIDIDQTERGGDVKRHLDNMLHLASGPVCP